MRKDENPNSTNVRSKGSPWKLGFFFVGVLILFSGPLFAADALHTGEITDSVRSNKDKTEANVLYVEKGAFVYGMENVTQVITSTSENKQAAPKPLTKKKKMGAKKKEAKPKAEPKVPKPPISVVLSSHPYEESFSLSKKSSAVATISLNQTLKSAVLENVTDIFAAITQNTNSSYSYTLFFKRGISGSRILTRPPPSFS